MVNINDMPENMPNNMNGMETNEANDNNFEKLQKLYEQGYRCIKYEDAKDEKMNIYLQNFDHEENTKHMEVSNLNEKSQILDFVNKYNIFK